MFVYEYSVLSICYNFNLNAIFIYVAQRLVYGTF